MANCPIKKVFYRPHAIHEWKHFETLDMIPKPKATTDRLTKAYERKFNAKQMEVLDQEGKPYWEIPSYIKYVLLYVFI